MRETGCLSVAEQTVISGSKNGSQYQSGLQTKMEEEGH
jgi:hypothetical protein